MRRFLRILRLEWGIDATWGGICIRAGVARAPQKQGLGTGVWRINQRLTYYVLRLTSDLYYASPFGSLFVKGEVFIVKDYVDGR